MLFLQCASITQICNRIVRDSVDPLVLQPASLEIATIKKKSDEELVGKLQGCLFVSEVVDPSQPMGDNCWWPGYNFGGQD